MAMRLMPEQELARKIMPLALLLVAAVAPFRARPGGVMADCPGAAKRKTELDCLLRAVALVPA
jgi:hypothetical protein